MPLRGAGLGGHGDPAGEPLPGAALTAQDEVRRLRLRPAHAQLLAKDLDDATLLRYIDRYVMYYVRTADRLQRTARWIEELPGGVDHVYDVVVRDSLGIGEDLEAAMAEHVDGYEDEWAATLRDPERLRRFRSFVNAPDAPDTGLAYVLERGQRRPATEQEKADAAAGAGPVLLTGPRIPVREEMAREDAAREGAPIPNSLATTEGRS